MMHAETFQGEFDDVFTGAEPIRQGDLLDLMPQGSDQDAEWASHFGVIVTADCDLVHGKHANVLSYVPIVPIQVYLRLLMFPRIIDTQVRLALRTLNDVLPSGEGWPTTERVLELVHQGRTEDLAGVLSVKDEDGSVQRQVNFLSECLQTQQAYDPGVPFSDGFAVMEIFLNSLRAISGQKALPPGQLLRKELLNRVVKNLPDDCLLLSRPIPSANEGYVAYLRLIREIRHDSIAMNTIHEMKLGNTARARRVARLSLIYLHRLTQQLTKVFADIGLPEQYERYCEDMVAGHIQTWVEATTPSRRAGQQ